MIFSLACLCWFFRAPAFRFGYGYLIGAALLSLLAWLKARMPVFFLYWVLGLCLVYAGNGLRNEFIKVSASQLLWPGAYPQTTATPHRLGEVLVLVPSSGRCWNALIPCTLGLESGLELRGSSLQHGFRINPKFVTEVRPARSRYLTPR